MDHVFAGALKGYMTLNNRDVFQT